MGWAWMATMSTRTQSSGRGWVSVQLSAHHRPGLMSVAGGAMDTAVFLWHMTYDSM